MSDRDTLETLGQLCNKFSPANTTQSVLVDIFFDDNVVLEDKVNDSSSKSSRSKHCIAEPQQLLSSESSEALLEVLFDDVNSAEMLDINDRSSQKDGAVFHGGGGAIMDYNISTGGLDPSAFTLAAFEVTNNKRKCWAPGELLSALTNSSSNYNPISNPNPDPSQNAQIPSSSSSALTKVAINHNLTEQKQHKKQKQRKKSGQCVPVNVATNGSATKCAYLHTKQQINCKPDREPDYRNFWPILSSLYNESNERDIHLHLTAHCSSECRLSVCKKPPRRKLSSSEEEEEEEELPLIEDTHIGIENVHRFWCNLLKQVPGGLFESVIQPCDDIKSKLESTVKLKLVYQYMFSGQVVLMNAEGAAHVDKMRYQTPGILTLTIDCSEKLIVDIHFAYKII